MRQMLINNDRQNQSSMQQAQVAQQSTRGLSLSAQDGSRVKQADDQYDKMLLHRALKKKRSMNYMNQLQVLDSGGQLLDPVALEQLLQEIQVNLGALDTNLGIPVGIISKCYLGDPYEVHSLDVENSVIEHYVQGQPMPGILENYRGMAMKGSYEFIEVYTTCICAVRSNGNVTLIEV
ncbi:MAG: hypothetical protein HFJ64_06875 [Eggerthellaceae bacterium]|nr:hypothetical protein [Eggerthellaceae bacterium]